MRPRILVSTILYGSFDPIPYTSHCNFWYRLGRELPDYDFIFHSPWRYPIDRARNRAAMEALRVEAEWLFFYDTDMVLYPNVLKILLERDKPMIMAHCLIRGYPFENMIFRYSEKEANRLVKYKPTPEDTEKGIIEVDAVGCAATLINTGVLKQLEQPYFLTGEYHTEDIYFCASAKSKVAGFSCWVDFTCECGHQLDPFILTSENAQALREFHEKGFGAIGQRAPVSKPKYDPTARYDNPFLLAEKDGLESFKFVELDKEDGLCI